MSLYNTLFKENEHAEALLEMLNLSREDFGRYRDCYLNKDGSNIIVYTRCGGDNREDYDYVFNNVCNHKYYITDYDDDFDNTYCYFVFKTPDIFLDETKKMSNGKDPDSVGEKFKKEIEEMKIPNSDAAKRAEALAKQIQKGIEEQPNGGIILI